MLIFRLDQIRKHGKVLSEDNGAVLKETATSTNLKMLA